MSRVVFKTTAGSAGTGGVNTPDSAKASLATNFKVVEFDAGELIFREGDLGTEMFIVQEGRVEISKKVAGDVQKLAIFEKGDFFGEMSLLEELPRTATAKAMLPSKLIEINGTTFDRMLRSNPEIAVRMMRKLSRRLRETDRLLQERGAGGGHVAEMPPAEATSDKATAPQRFVHVKTGMEFFLAQGKETTVGRRDPVTGIHPDIDLTPVDDKRSISRRHAKVYRTGDKFFVSEEIGTMNGTFVNGVRIETGVPAEIKVTDEVSFGLVVTIFHLD
jgi:CRP-like cAMP-binding protein